MLQIDRRWSPREGFWPRSPQSGPQRENFSEGTNVDTGPPKSYWAPQASLGAHAVKSFFARRV